MVCLEIFQKESVSITYNEYSRSAPVNDTRVLFKKKTRRVGNLQVLV